ncbi:methyl-accepting chemotaxis protein [Massilia sp. ZL223]|uniref:methyl-accepting chemotaxis protein n=1 Tax=Massilia sp. ZL223 TaxID=2824904 RepID=UPI0027D98327|nr:methyl-accepting chemotaxis protein [Massilia sp. ZL223]
MIPTTPTIGARLRLSYGVVFLLMICLSALAMMRMGEVRKDLDRIEDNKIKLRYAAEMRVSVHDRATALRDVVLAADPAAATAPISQIKLLDDSYARSAEPLDTLFKELKGVLPEEKEALAAIRAQEHRAKTLMNRVIELHAAGEAAEASLLLSQQAAPALVDWLATVKRFIELEDKLNEEAALNARRTAGGFSGWLAQLCVIAIAAAAFSAWFVGRGLGKPAAQPEEPAAEPAAPISDKAAELIGVIDGIAFQAHILALNAAVEAAKTAEQGGECAMAVADVRDLARRSATAARDIRTLVGRSPGQTPAEPVGEVEA